VRPSPALTESAKRLTELLSAGDSFTARTSGVLKKYDWGTSDGLRAWAQGVSESPQAELWYGDHLSGDSIVLEALGAPHKPSTLSALTKAQAPLLLKLISCAKPLSIQVHPDEATAKAGLIGFKTDTGEQVLVDSSGKDEMLLALSQFDLLAGFVTPEAGSQTLRDFGGAFDAAAEAFQAGQVLEAVKMILQESALQMNRLLPLLPAPVAFDLGEEVMATNDPALVVAALMQRVRLNPGEAIHVPPGTVHAYIGGTGVELMTTSDNVLRLGLTNKPRAVEAALSLIRLDAVREIPPQLEGGVRVFSPAGAPFELRDLAATEPSTFEIPGRRFHIVLALDGPCDVVTAQGRVTCATGQAVVISQRAGESPRAIIVSTARRAVAASTKEVAN
jgi:mannose-6-phosphate isomerase